MSKNLGRRLEKLRADVGMSQEQFADAVGVSRQTVYRWETDYSRPSLDNISAICEVLGVKKESFLNYLSDDKDTLYNAASETDPVTSMMTPIDEMSIAATEVSYVVDLPGSAQNECSDTCGMYARRKRKHIAFIVMAAVLFSVSLFFTVCFGFIAFGNVNSNSFDSVSNYAIHPAVAILFIIMTVVFAISEVCSIISYMRFKMRIKHNVT